jgi:competence protein ComEC
VKPHRPLFAVALALAAGAWLAAELPALGPVWAPLVLVAASLSLARAFAPGPAGSCSRLALALLFVLAGWRSHLAAGAGEPREGRFQPAYVGSATVVGSVGGAVRLEVDAGALAPGERVHVLPGEAPIPPPRGPFPAAQARSTQSVRADQVRRLEPAVELLPRPWRAGREQLIERAGELETGAARGLARALVCGDVRGLDGALADLFVRTGLRHLLAVSGLHVGLVASLVALLLAPLVRARSARTSTLATLAAAALIAIYVPFSGGAPPVRRAALALVLALVAALVPRAGGGRGRGVDPPSLWSLALILECCANPRAPTEVGVQLSYLATLGLILGVRRVGDGLANVLGCGRRRAPVRSGEPPAYVRTIAARVARAAVLAVGASLAAVLATAPVAWHVFGECSPLGIVTTPLALPLVAWLLVYGWAVLLAPASLPAELFELPAAWLVSFLEVCDALPGTPAPLPQRPGWALAALAGATLMALARGRGWARAAGLTWAGALVPWSPAPAGLELIALDVGHGTAVALRAPGAPCWIFDAGSKDRPSVARSALAPLLAAWEVPQTAVVLSHGDRDHASALPWLIERYPPRVWGGALPAPLRERLAHSCTILDTRTGRLRLPLTSNGPLSLTLLGGAVAAGNEGSRALEVSFAGRRVVLLGDAEQEGLAALLRQGTLQGPTERLLAPHHGSDCPWLGPLLAATEPDEVWISAAAEPPIGRELDRRRIPWSWTARDGPLIFRGPWHGVRNERSP